VHDTRRRCSLEFWFHLPVAESVKDEIVLARRSMSSTGDDIARLCKTGDIDGFLWDFVLLPSGELEFRSIGGTSLLSSCESNSEFELNLSMGDFGDETQNSKDDGGLVSWERAEGGGSWKFGLFVATAAAAKCDCSVKMFTEVSRYLRLLRKLSLLGSKATSPQMQIWLIMQ